MKHKYSVAVVAVVMLMATLTLALYYRTKAVHLRQELDDTLARLEKMAVQSARVPVIEAASSMRSYPKSAAVSENPTKEPAGSVRPTPGALAVTATSQPERPQEPNRPQRRGGREWIETLKTNDPARYAQIQQRREEMRQNADNAWSQTTDYFMDRDTSNMSQQNMEEYSRMMILLDQTRGLNQQMQNDLPHDERHQVMAAVRSNMVELAPLLNNERDREFYDMALAAGYNVTDASSMVIYANQIVSNTSIRTIFPFMRGGPPGDRFFGGGREAPTPPPQ